MHHAGSAATWMAAAAILTSTTLAHADDVTLRVREYPSWAEVLVAVSKEPLRAGAEIHVQAQGRGGLLQCNGYEVHLPIRLQGIFHVGGCTDGVTTVTLIHPEGLPENADADAAELSLTATLPATTLATAQSTTPAGAPSGESSPPVATSGSGEDRAASLREAGGTTALVSFVLAPAFIYGFLEGGFNITDSLVYSTAICLPGVLIGGVIAVIGLAAEPGGRASVHSRRGFALRGAGVAPVDAGRGVAGTVVFQF